MPDLLIKISKILPRIFLAVFVLLFVMQIVGFFFIYFLGSKV
jgi:hypothetical protein